MGDPLQERFLLGERSLGGVRGSAILAADDSVAVDLKGECGLEKDGAVARNGAAKLSAGQ